MTIMGDCYNINYSRKLMCIIFYTLAILNAMTGMALAQQDPGQITKKLSRGINLSHWFAQSFRGYDRQHLETFVSEADITRLVKIGITHVRIPVSMAIAFRQDDMAAIHRGILREKVSYIIVSGIAVVIDIHPTEDEKRAMMSDSSDSQFVEGWSAFAKEFASFSPADVAFEIMNEPYPIAGERWASIQKKAVDSIRSVAPRHTIVVNPGGWSTVSDYDNFRSLDANNLVYTVHMYEPHLFTHQGAEWGWVFASQIRALPWPIAAKDAQANAEASAADGEPRHVLLDQIAKGLFEQEWITRHLDKLTRWQAENPRNYVWVGEFGVYRKLSPMASRLSWHGILRSEFERRGWGWALWDYAGGFGLILEGSQQRGYDGDLIRELGLNAEN